MAKKEIKTQEQILSEIQQRNFKPLYLLMGEEAYGIDVITEAIVETALTEEERDFNQTILYGGSCSVSDIINCARRYPMMSQRQLVVVKEAQQLRNLEELVFYAQKPLMSTVLVINYKNGAPRSKKLIAEFEKNGTLFESKKLYDNQLPAFISSYFIRHQTFIDPKATAMLAEAVGTDLSRMRGEMDKLLLLIPQEAQRRAVTPQLVEEHIGISKEYNNFELLKSLLSRDVKRVFLIQYYFEKNPKAAGPLLVTTSVLFNFFANLMLLYFNKDKSEHAIMETLRLRSVYQAKDYSMGLRNYNAFQCMAIISLLRQYDCRSKGVNNGSASNSELLKELLFKILHAQ